MCTLAEELHRLATWIGRGYATRILSVNTFKSSPCSSVLVPKGTPHISSCLTSIYRARKFAENIWVVQNETAFNDGRSNESSRPIIFVTRSEEIVVNFRVRRVALQGRTRGHHDGSLCKHLDEDPECDVQRYFLLSGFREALLNLIYLKRMIAWLVAEDRDTRLVVRSRFQLDTRSQLMTSGNMAEGVNNIEKLLVSGMNSD